MQLVKRVGAILASAILLCSPGSAQEFNALVADGPTVETCTVERAIIAGVALTAAKTIDANSKAGLPAHCQIEGKFEQRIGFGGKPYAIAFQLRIPVQWNGRLLFQGGGGLNGAVNPALGEVIGASQNIGLAIGFAVVSTDSGHHGTDAGFAADQLAKLNYAYASIGKVAAVAKGILGQVTGSQPRRTYFSGCSNGGREAMLAAQRFPQEFDGVIAGSPAFNLSDATLLANFSTSVYRNAAPKAADGTSQLPLALLPSETKLLREALLRKCDALDGQADGFVFNHTACHFDPRALQCKAGQKAGECLTPSKLQMIRKAFAGPLGRDGKSLVSSWTFDTGIDSDSWRIWQMGLMMNGRPVVLLPRLVDETLARYFNYPMLDPTRLGTINYDTIIPRMAQSAAMANATSTQMSTFSAAGSKMLIVTGWSEPVFAPMDLIHWYQRLDSDMMKASGIRASDFSRLFMVPGMTHCGGGPALDQFDALSALIDWVEKGKAADQLIATSKAYPGVSRPLCPYPSFAHHERGPGEQASSYRCEWPSTAAAGRSIMAKHDGIPSLRR